MLTTKENTMSEYLLTLPKATIENLFFREMRKTYVLGAYGKKEHSHRPFFKRESKSWPVLFSSESCPVHIRQDTYIGYRCSSTNVSFSLPLSASLFRIISSGED